MRLVRLRFPVRLLHKPLEAVLLGINFSKPLQNIGAPPLRSLHLAREPDFFQFQHGQLKQGSVRASGAAAVHQPGHRMNMRHTSPFTSHSAMPFLSLSPSHASGYEGDPAALFHRIP